MSWVVQWRTASAGITLLRDRISGINIENCVELVNQRHSHRRVASTAETKATVVTEKRLKCPVDCIERLIIDLFFFDVWGRLRAPGTRAAFHKLKSSLVSKFYLKQPTTTHILNLDSFALRSFSKDPNRTLRPLCTYYFILRTNFVLRKHRGKTNEWKLIQKSSSHLKKQTDTHLVIASSTLQREQDYRAPPPHFDLFFYWRRPRNRPHSFIQCIGTTVYQVRIGVNAIQV